jgi:hypothetical protein
VIRAVALGALVLGGVGFLYGREAARAERPASPAASPATAIGVHGARAAAPSAPSPHRAGKGVTRPELPPTAKLETVSTAPRAGELPYDTRIRAEAVADWERFRVEAKVTPEQEAAILRIVYDVQVELTIDEEESWRIFHEDRNRATFNQFDDDVLETLQADLHARVRAVLTDEQAEIFGTDGQTIDVGRLQLIGGLVAVAK